MGCFLGSPWNYLLFDAFNYDGVFWFGISWYGVTGVALVLGLRDGLVLVLMVYFAV